MMEGFDPPRFSVPVALTLTAPPLTCVPFRFRMEPVPAFRVALCAAPSNIIVPPLTASTVPPVNVVLGEVGKMPTKLLAPLALIVPPVLVMLPVARSRTALPVAVIRPLLVREPGAKYTGALWLAMILPLLVSAEGAMYPEPWRVSPTTREPPPVSCALVRVDGPETRFNVTPGDRLREVVAAMMSWLIVVFVPRVTGLYAVLAIETEKVSAPLLGMPLGFQFKASVQTEELSPPVHTALMKPASAADGNAKIPAANRTRNSALDICPGL